jgi:AcrR family transcriptional regulator
MSKQSIKSRNLREACVEETRSMIAEDGPEQLSLREVARRLGVSHQAPYKHFPSRDHLLAEVVSRAFADFARYLDGRKLSGDPANDLGSLGQAYVRYALKNPLQYRLMFGTPLPNPDQHPEMLQNARHAFSVWRKALQQLYSENLRPCKAEEIDLEALFVWSAVHGLASILNTSAITTLPVSPAVLGATTSFTLQRIGTAIRSAPPDVDIQRKRRS